MSSERKLAAIMFTDIARSAKREDRKLAASQDPSYPRSASVVLFLPFGICYRPLLCSTALPIVNSTHSSISYAVTECYDLELNDTVTVQDAIRQKIAALRTVGLK